MEASDLKDFLEKHKDKCRCCFGTLPDRKFNGISEETAKRFYELTQIELIQSDEFSKEICALCENNLKLCSDFLTDLISKQKKLYDASKNVNKKAEPSFNNLQETYEEHQIDSDDFTILESIIEIKPETIQEPVLMTKSLEEKSISDYDEQARKLHDVIPKTPSNRKQSDEKKQLFCRLCDKSYASWGNLRMHTKSVHEKLWFRCPVPFCSQDFSNIYCTNRHILAKHQSLTPEVLKDFLKSLKETPPLVSPLASLTHSQESDEEHKIDSDDFTNMESIIAIRAETIQEPVSMTRSLEEKSISDYNEYQRKLYDELTELKKKSKHKNLKCPQCLKVLSRFAIRNHIEFVHSKQTFDCDHCSYKAAKRWLLLKHLEKIHKFNVITNRNQSDEKKRLFCSLCDKSYTRRTNLKKHTESVHEKLRFCCPVPFCRRALSNPRTAKKHVLLKHQNLAPEVLKDFLKTLKETPPSPQPEAICIKMNK